MPLPIEKKYTAEEFERMDLPERCELIYGDIYIGESKDKYNPQQEQIIAFSAPSIIHQEISVNVSSDIVSYIRKNKGNCKTFTAPTDVKISDDIIVQPDIFVTCNPDKIDGKYLKGSPDWVIEILSPSTAHKDFSSKLSIYKNYGVREYWIIDPIDNRVIVYIFEKNNSTSLYTFTDDVPVYIYKDNPEPLTIRIADYFDWCNYSTNNKRYSQNKNGCTFLYYYIV